MATPVLVLYTWLVLPLTRASGELAFMSVVGWHALYAFLCVHMAAAIFKSFPTEWRPGCASARHWSCPVWNAIAVIAAAVDVAFLVLCRALDLYSDCNPMWIVSLVVAFLPVFTAAHVMSAPTTPNRLYRTLLSCLCIFLPLMGYVSGTVAAYLHSQVPFPLPPGSSLALRAALWGHQGLLWSAARFCVFVFEPTSPAPTVTCCPTPLGVRTPPPAWRGRAGRKRKVKGW